MKRIEKACAFFLDNLKPGTTIPVPNFSFLSHQVPPLARPQLAVAVLPGSIPTWSQPVMSSFGAAGSDPHSWVPLPVFSEQVAYLTDWERATPLGFALCVCVCVLFLVQIQEIMILRAEESVCGIGLIILAFLWGSRIDATYIPSMRPWWNRRGIINIQDTFKTWCVSRSGLELIFKFSRSFNKGTQKFQENLSTTGDHPCPHQPCCWKPGDRCRRCDLCCCIPPLHQEVLLYGYDRWVWYPYDTVLAVRPPNHFGPSPSTNPVFWPRYDLLLQSKSNTGQVRSFSDLF